jgi:hypothetical protein
VPQVHVVELKLSREEAARRHQAAAAAAAAGLEVADLGAEASQGLLGEASFMPQQQPVLAEEQVGWCNKAGLQLCINNITPCRHGSSLSTPGKLVLVAAEATSMPHVSNRVGLTIISDMLLLVQPASPAASVKAPDQQLEVAFDASWLAYMQEAPRLDLVMHGQLQEKHPVLYREVCTLMAQLLH